jgi:hypothetical protein
MLCQLVCVDRRYQRMNCFNIREIQSILKRKFFTDLINTHEHHSLLDKTAMGLRFKTNNINSINSNVFIFYNYGLEFAPKIRTSFFSNNFDQSSPSFFSNNNSLLLLLTDKFSNFNIFFFINNFYLYLTNSLCFVSSFNTTFKNVSLSLFSTFIYFYDNFFLLLNNIVESLSSFFSIYSIIIKNFSDFFNLFFYFFSPFYFLYFIVDIISSFFYNIFSLKVNMYTFNFYFDLNLTFFNFFSLFYEFFFFIKFFEIIYFFNTNFFNFSYILNNFYFFSIITNLYTNLKFSFFTYFNFYFPTNSFSFNKETTTALNNYSNSNHYVFNKKTSNNYSNDILDYSSYFVYFYTLLFSLINIPFILITLIKNIFNFSLLLNVFLYYYDVLVS